MFLEKIKQTWRLWTSTEKSSQMPKECRPQMYVVVRGDFSPTYKMAQGAHALAAFDHSYPEVSKGEVLPDIFILKLMHFNE